MLSPRLLLMYVRELFITGTDQDFLDASPCFQKVIDEDEHTDDEIIGACHVLAKVSLINKDDISFLSYALRITAAGGSAEICTMLGDFYYARDSKKDASLWYYNAVNETECLYNHLYADDYAPHQLEKCT